VDLTKIWLKLKEESELVLEHPYARTYSLNAILKVIPINMMILNHFFKNNPMISFHDVMISFNIWFWDN
jgi:hypothetical protein